MGEKHIKGICPPRRFFRGESLESAVGFVGKNGSEVTTGVRFVRQAPQSSPHAFVPAADRGRRKGAVMTTTASSMKGPWTCCPPYPRWPLKSPSARREARALPVTRCSSHLNRILSHQNCREASHCETRLLKMWQAEAGESQVQSHPWLYSKSEGGQPKL